MHLCELLILLYLQDTEIDRVLNALLTELLKDVGLILGKGSTCRFLDKCCVDGSNV